MHVLPVHQSVYNKSTNWETFGEILESTLITNVPLKTDMNIEQAIVYYNDTVTDFAKINKRTICSTKLH